MKTYLISEIADELITTKSRVSRSISKLKLNAVNEKNRIHKNSPKVYDLFARNLVEIDLMSVTERSVAQQGALQERINNMKGVKATINDDKDEKQKKSQQSVTIKKTERYEAQREIIDVLKTQLNKANDEKDGLMRLLDQQQRLSANDRKKIEILELELKEVKISEYEPSSQENDSSKHETKKSKWYEIWKKTNKRKNKNV